MRRFSMLVLGLIVALALAPHASASAAKRHPPKFRCTITGTSGADHLRGTPGRDVICAGAGDDQIAALGGNDEVFAGAGDDRVDGGPGADNLRGGPGDDRMTGGPGPDGLFGEGGGDRLDGEGGADAVYGDLGADSLSGDATDLVSGGPGQDVGDPYDASGVPDCPDGSFVPPSGIWCRFHMHFDDSFPYYCPNYKKMLGLPPCIGSADYGPVGWSAYGKPFINRTIISYNAFSWTGPTGTPKGPATPKSTQLVWISPVPIGYLGGVIPDPNSHVFVVNTAWSVAKLNVGWVTPITAASVAPGQLGGPLYFTFVNGSYGADVYIDGYLRQT
jgi:Ca2+-binding RTX toxin-like protein